jgi:flagellar biosynthesis GTPase FlhF
MSSQVFSARDSASAMDQVFRTMGEDAFILETRTRDGMVEIEATMELPKPTRPRQRPKQAFKEIIEAKDADLVNKGIKLVSLSQADDDAQEDAPEDKATEVLTHTPSQRIAEQPSITAQPQPAAKEEAHTQTAAAPTFVKAIPAKPYAFFTEAKDAPIAGPADTAWLDAIEDRLGGTQKSLADLTAQIETHFQTLSAALAALASAQTASPAHTQATATGIQTTPSLRPGPAELPPLDPEETAQALAAPRAHQRLEAQILLVCGPSGSGKTTLCAKLADRAMAHGASEIEFGELAGPDRIADRLLRDCARIMQIPMRKITPESGLALGKSGRLIIEISTSRADAHALMVQCQKSVGAANVTTVLCLPGGASTAMIDTQLDRFAKLEPVVALTKLDECGLERDQIRALSEEMPRVAILAGTASLYGGLEIAENDNLARYLHQICQECKKVETQ